MRTVLSSFLVDKAKIGLEGEEKTEKYTRKKWGEGKGKKESTVGGRSGGGEGHSLEGGGGEVSFLEFFFWGLVGGSVGWGIWSGKGGSRHWVIWSKAGTSVVAAAVSLSLSFFRTAAPE